MRITFWGDTSELVQTGKSYLISHVSTRMFNGELTLNTTMSTKISQIEDVEDPKEDLTFIEEKEEIISISQIKITQNYKCCNTSCNKTIPEIDFQNSFIRCQACQMKQSIKKMKRATTAFLNVTLENSTTTKFVIFEEALHKFLDLEKNAQLLENPDQLEDHLLEIEQFKVSHQSHSDVLSKINRIPVSNQSE
ncbi:hypothetical protein FSP39_009394 [Pinctada imbricata]|uniref:Uncharacterized protein n=1 Tax=Pinctada imbricata TaxID=66713 RepID=A0AA88XHP1_PINIB|nr:hypothetical protein FSP39_009394 [Pinctada imbricata]